LDYPHYHPAVLLRRQLGRRRQWVLLLLQQLWRLWRRMLLRRLWRRMLLQQQ